MSIVYGTAEFFDQAMQDPKLEKALEKLTKQIIVVNSSGCSLVTPMKNGEAARFMIKGDYDLSRRWSWRIYNGPIPAGHRVYVNCHETHCVEPTHLYVYKAERTVRPRPMGVLGTV